MNKYLFLSVLTVIIISIFVASREDTIPVLINSYAETDSEISGFYIKEINNGKACQDISGTDFVVFGDTQPRDKDELALSTKIVNQIAKLDPDFVIHTGDHVENGVIGEQEWKDYFDMISILRTKPYYGAIGNHDVINGGGGASVDYSMWDKYFGKRYQSFDEAGSHFIILDDIGSLYLGGDVDSEQKEWLLNDLPNCKKANFCFVFMHVPPVSWKGGAISTEDTKLMPLFKQNGVDAVFSGHVHVYERGNIEDVGYLVGGGGGNKFHEPTGEGSNAQVLDAFPYEDKTITRTNHFIKISYADKAYGCIYNINGEIIDSFEIEQR